MTTKIIKIIKITLILILVLLVLMFSWVKIKNRNHWVYFSDKEDEEIVRTVLGKEKGILNMVDIIEFEEISRSFFIVNRYFLDKKSMKYHYLKPIEIILDDDIKNQWKEYLESGYMTTQNMEQLKWSLWCYNREPLDGNTLYFKEVYPLIKGSDTVYTNSKLISYVSWMNTDRVRIEAIYRETLGFLIGEKGYYYQPSLEEIISYYEEHSDIIDDAIIKRKSNDN